MRAPILSYARLKDSILAVEKNGGTVFSNFLGKYGQELTIEIFKENEQVRFGFNRPATEYYEMTDFNVPHLQYLFDKDECFPSEFLAHELAEAIITITDRQTGENLTALFDIDSEKVIIPESQEILSLAATESKYKIQIPEHDLSMYEKANSFSESQFWNVINSIEDKSKSNLGHEGYLIEKSMSDPEMHGFNLRARKLVRELMDHLNDEYDILDIAHTNRLANHVVMLGKDEYYSVINGKDILEVVGSDLNSTMSVDQLNIPYTLQSSYPYQPKLSVSSPKLYAQKEAGRLLSYLRDIDYKALEAETGINTDKVKATTSNAIARLECVLKGDFDTAIKGWSHQQYENLLFPSINIPMKTHETDPIIGASVSNLMKDFVLCNAKTIYRDRDSTLSM
ncbi:hypothetical protein VB319_23205 [Vibrio parahaemolyticus]|uniref:hypothetical protein n=1 Tax=Vibrio parahaemolyticus TaxID=670 RepID=UPI002B2066F6|nr:hypothetical protein [Vibrio parahaemolyticus]MEA5356849.1 hypothetical protein [Vibrio parahaemolyticus]